MIKYKSMEEEYKEYPEVHKKIKEILNECAGGEYIFRGEKENYEYISSGLYRYYCGTERGAKDPLIDPKHFSVIWQKDIVQRAGRHFHENISQIGILTELQHHGGKTTLIDFTHNLHAALFFACNGSFKEDGRVILINEAGLKRIKDWGDDIYTDGNEHIFIPPVGKNTRAIFQSGVFVHSQKGFIDEKYLNDNMKKIPIEKDMKGDILDYLKKRFGIHTDTVYNDMHGFIQNKENYFVQDANLYVGIEYMRNQKDGEAEKHFTEYIDSVADERLFAPHLFRAIVRNRMAIAMNKTDLHKLALKDINKAMSIGSKDGKDINKAMSIGSKDGFEYLIRADIRSALNQFSDALADYRIAYDWYKKLDGEEHMVQVIERNMEDIKTKMRRGKQ